TSRPRAQPAVRPRARPLRSGLPGPGRDRPGPRPRQPEPPIPCSTPDAAGFRPVRAMPAPAPGRCRPEDDRRLRGSPMSDASAADTAPPPGALRRLLRRPLALLGIAVILALVAAAALAPVLSPYRPEEQLFDGLTLTGAPLPPGG